MKRQTKLVHVGLALALLVAGPRVSPANARALVDGADPLRISASATGIQLQWNAPPNAFSQIAARALVPTEIGGALLPAHLIALRLPSAAPLVPRIAQLASVPWLGALPAAAAAIPQTASGDERPALAQPALHALPRSPLVVLRDGRMRGIRIVILAFSPLFLQGAALRSATTLQATIPGAALFAGDAAQLLATSARPFTSAPAPTNPAAAVDAIKLRVTQPGIQRVTGAALAAAGINLTTLTPSHIHLRFGGVELACEERGTADGHLDPADELRFYAPARGDRWNAADTYWLTIEPQPGRRMSIRDTLPGSALARTTALGDGTWRQNMLYDSTLPGPDGDHWFAGDLKTGPGAAPATLSLPLTPTLPLASGAVTLTITGSTYTADLHTLSVALGGAAQLATWSGAGDWTRTFTFTGTATDVVLTLVPGSAPDGLEIDSVAWSRPVLLDLAGRGALFNGLAGTWRYQLANTTADRALYDLSDPLAPQRLTLPAATSEFQDGPLPHQYLLAGPGVLQTPVVSTSTPSTLAAPRAADIIYIAPAAFLPALAPLIAWRQAQAHTVALIDVQAIYDAWSFGQISPDAIRAFIRYAAATWDRAPTAVTLVGDGTSDPLNYTRRDNTTFIPPYLAMVDPWIGETACETCYAQLDGDNPLSDPLPDVALGRLPVKSAAELQTLVAKIIGYENASGGMDWRSRGIYIADNYRDANGTSDSAGDFAAAAERSIALQPAGIAILRLYYDPSPSSVGVAWREPDSGKAHTRTLALLNSGAGLVTYTGHSHQWQLAVTDPAATPSYLLGLYDADALTNDARPSIMLEMTCLTSAFQTPAYSGTTIDERLLLHPRGGAIAVWGSTGLGVAHGHDTLQHGFYGALWSAPPLSAPIGMLTLAGYLDLFMNGGCCQDTIRTFALLGDPAMPARVQPAQRVYLPFVQR
jgi:hypothetical protein